MPVLKNIGCLYRCDAAGAARDLHPVRDAAVVWRGERIAWAGPARELPAEYAGEPVLEAGGGLVFPGLVDCHTHLAFGGWRSDEFALRALGAGYLDIARAGGGIASTVRHTRAASAETLVEKALPILHAMVRLGVTTVECKSGYGLTFEDEMKLLRVYRELAGRQPVRLVPTLLAAHIVPPEYRDRREDYLRMITDELIPAVAAEKLARFCDVFVEETAFTPAEAERVLEAGERYGLRPKLHVDQLADGGGAALAARVGAISADHLEHVSPAGIEAMAGAGVVAVGLPFAAFNLRQPGLPARACIDAGVAVAVATDFNPGSAPSYHLPAALYMACILQRMEPAEAVKGATIVAARAIGMDDEIGSVAPGKRADLIVVDALDVDHWVSHLRPGAVTMTVIGGRLAFESR